MVPTDSQFSFIKAKLFCFVKKFIQAGILPAVVKIFGQVNAKARVFLQVGILGQKPV